MCMFQTKLYLVQYVLKLTLLDRVSTTTILDSDSHVLFCIKTGDRLGLISHPAYPIDENPSSEN